jgi:hypothetical protein
MGIDTEGGDNLPLSSLLAFHEYARETATLLFPGADKFLHSIKKARDSNISHDPLL